MKKTVTIMIVIMMVLLMATGCGSSKTVLTVDGNEIPMGEAVFVLREMETMYEGQFGPTIWSTGYEGKSFNDIAKNGAIESLTRLYITKLEAQKQGVELSDEELTEVDEMQEEYLIVKTEKELKEDGISLDDLHNVFVYNFLGEKLMDLSLVDFEVDDAALEAALAEDVNYKQIQTHGYEGVLEKVTAQHILFSTVNEDKSEKSDEEKMEALETATKVLEDIRAGSITFKDAIDQYSDDPAKVDNDGTYSFYKGEMAPEFEDAAFNMKIDEVSDLVLTEFGYHIIKKIDHILPSEEDIKNVMEYESFLIEQYEMAQKQEAYNVLYEGWKTDYKVEVNDKVWSEVQTSFEKAGGVANDEEMPDVTPELTPEETPAE